MNARFWDADNRQWVDLARELAEARRLADSGDPAASALARLAVVLWTRVDDLERRLDAEEEYRREQVGR